MAKLQKRHVVFWVLSSASGCAKDETAMRPAHDPGDAPRSDAGARPPVVDESPPVASSAPAVEPSDPLLSKPVDCGPAEPNPHGVALEWMTRRDGSCKVCETAPAPLPACHAGQRGTQMTAKTLEAQRGKRVSFAGTLSLTNAMCTKRGGHCACNNRCGAPLRLAGAGPAAPFIALTSKGEHLACLGDEGGLCCPFAMDGKRAIDVVVSGKLVELGGEESAVEPGVYLEAETICTK